MTFSHLPGTEPIPAQTEEVLQNTFNMSHNSNISNVPPILPNETGNLLPYASSTQRATAVLGLQRQVGNQAVQRILRRSQDTTAIQRQPSAIQRDIPYQWLNDNFPFEPFGSRAPRPVNWETMSAMYGGASASNLTPGWNERPNFPNGYEAHEANADLDRGKVRFQSDWSVLQNSWNHTATLSDQYGIRAMLPDVLVTSINGVPVPPPPQQLRVPGTEHATPHGGYQIESIFTPGNTLDMATPFNPARLNDADRVTFNTATARAMTSRTDRIRQERVVEREFNNVDSRLSQVSQAEIRQRQAHAGEQRVDETARQAAIQREQANLTAIIGATQSVLKAGIKRNLEATVEAGASVAGAISTNYYNGLLAEVQSCITSIDMFIARGNTQFEMENVRQRRNDVLNQMTVIRDAITTLDQKLNDERTAFEAFSVTIEQLARRQGLSAEDARTARTAAGAIPMIDATIGKITEVQAAIVLPTYSNDSGIGASLVTNVDAFASHLGNLRAYQTHLNTLKQQWLARRSAAESGTGMPSLSPTP